MRFEMFRLQGHWPKTSCLTLAAEMSKKQLLRESSDSPSIFRLGWQDSDRASRFRRARQWVRQPFDFVNPLVNIVQPPEFVQPFIQPPLVHQPIIDSDAAWWHGLPLLTRHNGFRVRWGWQQAARPWIRFLISHILRSGVQWKLTGLTRLTPACCVLKSIVEALLNLWQSVATRIFLLQLRILQWSKKWQSMKTVSLQVAQWLRMRRRRRQCRLLGWACWATRDCESLLDRHVKTVKNQTKFKKSWTFYGI